MFLVPRGRLLALAEGGGGREGGTRPLEPVVFSLPLPLPPPPSPSVRVGRGGGEEEEREGGAGRGRTGGGVRGSGRGDLMWEGPVKVLLRPLSFGVTVKCYSKLPTELIHHTQSKTEHSCVLERALPTELLRQLSWLGKAEHSVF